MKMNPTVTEVARNFAAYINRVALRGERFVLMRGKKPVAELRPLPRGGRLGELPQLMESLPGLEPDEALAFSEDLKRAAAELNVQAPRDPWAS